MQHGIAGIEICVMRATDPSHVRSAGVLWMAHASRRARAVPAKRIDSYVTMSGGMSGGTVRSGIVGDTRHAHKLSDPFLLGDPSTMRATAASRSSNVAKPLLSARTGKRKS